MATKSPYLNENHDLIPINKNTNLQNEIREYSKSVDCGGGHYFCW